MDSIFQFGLLLTGVSSLLVAVGALYVFIKFAGIIDKMEEKLDKELDK